MNAGVPPSVLSVAYCYMPIYLSIYRSIYLSIYTCGVLTMPSVCALRTQAFRLQPLKMSQDLIAQLTAVAVKLEGCANRLQESIKKKKSKNKHYREVIEEAHVLSLHYRRFMFTTSPFCR